MSLSSARFLIGPHQDHSAASPAQEAAIGAAAVQSPHWSQLKQTNTGETWWNNPGETHNYLFVHKPSKRMQPNQTNTIQLRECGQQTMLGMHRIRPMIDWDKDVEDESLQMDEICKWRLCCTFQKQKPSGGTLARGQNVSVKQPFGALSQTWAPHCLG